MSKRWVVGVGAGVVIVVLAVGGVLLTMRKKPHIEPPKLTTYHHDETGATFDHTTALDVQTLSEQDAKDRIIFRGQSDSKEAPFLITLRYETGLRLASVAAKTETIDLVANGATKALPSRFPEYHQVSERRMDQGGKKAAEIIFTYKGPSGERAKQRLLMVVKDDNTAFYLAGQCKEADYDKLAGDYFNGIFDSLRFE